MPVSLRMYLSLLYQILTLLYWLQHCVEEYSADTAQINTWKGCYANDIALSTTNLATAIWYNQLSWEHVCTPGGYTT